MLRTCKRLVAPLLLTVLLAGTAYAQQGGAISGAVTDRATGAPVPDANVVIVGTTRGTRTDATGHYKLASPAGTFAVRVTRLGYTALTRPVTVTNGDVTADFQLNETAATIDQVVITAAGTSERKRENGNDVGIIKPGELVSTAATPSLSETLSGKEAGLTIQTSTGTPGTASKIRIRGANSVSLSNDPLLIVDGVRMDNSSNSLLFASGIGGATTSRLDDINPEDIETVEILKGPAASALYGTAASNGVIVITTKRGHSGKTTWRAYADYGHMWDPTHYPTNYYVMGTALTGKNAGKLYNTSCTLDAQSRGLCKPDSTFSFNPTQYYHVLGTGHNTDYGLSASGGSDVAQYYIAGDAQRVQGIVAPSQTHNYSTRANITAQLRPNLNATFNANYIDRYIQLPYNDNNIYGVVPQGLLGKAFNCVNGVTGGAATICGTDTLSHGFYSTLPSTYYFMRNTQATKRFVGGGNVTWQPFSWLTGAGQAGVDMDNTLEEVLVPSNVVTFINSGLTQGYVYEYRRQIPDYTANGSFTATKSFDRWGGFQSSTSLGSQYINEQSHYTYGFGAQLIPGTGSLATATARPAIGENNQTIITVGGYGREELSWRDRLFLTASLRGDENSAFGSNFKLAWYPAVSLSWVASEEPFMRDLGFVSSGLLSQLRLRGAYGQAGQRPGFRQAETYLNAAAVAQGPSEVSGVVIGGTGNPNLAPEISAEEEAGFDASFFDNRATLVYTFYHKVTRDALIARTLPPSFGLSTTQFVNLGRVKNQGNELSLNVTALDRRVTKIELNVAGSVNTNKLLSLGNVPPISFNGNTQRHTEGYPLGAFFNQHYTYADKNGDHIISRDEITYGGTSTKDEYIGSPFPTRELSVTPTFTFLGNLRLASLWNYQGGFYVFNNTEEFRCTSSAFKNCYEVNNPNAPLDEQAAAVAYLDKSTNYGYIQKGDFLKLREVSATFTVPSRWVPPQLGATGLSFTLAGHNLQTWTKYKGFDPEINSLQYVTGTGTGFIQSDFLTQPPVRTWTLRADLTF